MHRSDQRLTAAALVLTGFYWMDPFAASEPLTRAASDGHAHSINLETRVELKSHGGC